LLSRSVAVLNCGRTFRFFVLWQNEFAWKRYDLERSLLQKKFRLLAEKGLTDETHIVNEKM
jgi:hypothetical protein